MSESGNSEREDDKIAALKIVISAALSLAVMIVEFTWLIREEVRVIWRFRSWYARIYLFFRYTGLASQIFNVYFAIRMYAGVPSTPAGCRLWFSYQAVVVQILLASVEGALMHRIYVLFLCNQYILMILVVLATGQVASMAISASISLPSNQHTVTCMMVKSNPGNAYFGVTTMTTSILIFFMTFCRFRYLPTRWTRHVVARMMIRDTSLSLLTIFGWMLFLTLCSLGVIRPSVGGNITYHWFVCTLWISIGRIIVNKEVLTDEEYKSTIQLTSRIEVEVTRSQGHPAVHGIYESARVTPEPGVVE